MTDDPASKLSGSWRLVAAYVVDESGKQSDLYGSSPCGRIMLGSDGRMMAFLMSSGRTAAASEAEIVFLFKSMMVYTGKYVLDGDKFTTDVDMAWEPSWQGTKQTRYYTLEGDKLQIRTTPTVHPAFGGKVVGHLHWEREG